MRGGLPKVTKTDFLAERNAWRDEATHEHWSRGPGGRAGPGRGQRGRPRPTAYLGGVGGPRAGCVRVCVPAPDAIVMR